VIKLQKVKLEGDAKRKQLSCQKKSLTSKYLGKYANHTFRFLIRARKVAAGVYERFFIMIQKGLTYSLNCLKGPSMKYLKQKQVELGQNSGNFPLFY